MSAVSAAPSAPSRHEGPLDLRHLIEWLAKDRCFVTVGTGMELTANRKAFTAIVKAWIKYL